MAADRITIADSVFSANVLSPIIFSITSSQDIFVNIRNNAVTIVSSL